MAELPRSVRFDVRTDVRETVCKDACKGLPWCRPGVVEGVETPLAVALRVVGSDLHVFRRRIRRRITCVGVAFAMDLGPGILHSKQRRSAQNDCQRCLDPFHDPRPAPTQALTSVRLHQRKPLQASLQTVSLPSVLTSNRTERGSSATKSAQIS